jgi:hypothetical protein
MAHIALALLAGSGNVSSQCMAPGTFGTVTAPTGATGCTVELWGGGGGGSSNPGLAGYGGGGAAFVKRSFSVTGGSTQIGYTVAGMGSGGGPYSDGTDGPDSIINVPPTLPTITLTAGGGKGGQTTAPGAAGTTSMTGGIPWDLGVAPTAGGISLGGNAGNVAGGGGTNGAPGNTPGGGGNDSGVTGGFGFSGGNGSVCFYWTYPTNIVLSDQSALNNSLAGVGGTATATYQLASTGAASRTNSAGVLTAISGEWLTSGTAADYEVYAEWGSGGGTTGGATPDTWLGLGTTRNFTLTATNNSVQRELYIRIRLAATQAVVNFCTITVSVDSAP